MEKEEIINKIKNTRILAIIGLVAMLLGLILPYARYSLWGAYISVSLWKSWQGVLAILLILANTILIFKDYIEKNIPKVLEIPAWKKISNINNPKLTLIPTAASTLLVIWLSFSLNIVSSSYSIGFYLLWLGVICLVVYAIINKGNLTKSVSINNANINNNGVQQNNANMNNNNNGMQQNMNPNYNNMMNNNNNGMQQNMNLNYNNMNNNNNGMQQNMNPNYNNMNNNNNGMQQNANQNYNNQNNMNNNGAQQNANQNYNNQNNRNNNG